MPKIGWKPLLLAALCGGVGAAAAEPFTFVAWNVGHFADGRKGTSTIATTNVPARRAAYRALFRELDAKVVGLVEYSPLFDAAGNVLTANAILDDYPHRLEGPVRGYHVNSVFLKDCDVLASRVVDYADHHQRTHHHDARVRIGGHEALVSITHLEPDWPTDMRAKRAAQMRQLVDDLAKEPRVVIAGDFNIVDKAELQPLLDAGYTHVSAAMLPTWPAKKPDQPIDHIFVKGFRASDFRVIARPDLSDHCLVACSLEPCETAAPPLARVTFRITYADGRVERRSAEAVRQADGAYRAQFRTIDMTRDMKGIDVVSDAAVVPKCDGYWTIGDGRWGAFDRDAAVPEPGRKTPRETCTRPWRMPIFGVKTPDACFVAIVKGMPLEHQQHVQVEKGVTTVFARYDLARIEFDPYDDIVVDYYPLTGADANYSGMARRYRAHQLAEGGCRPLRERVKGNPALAYAAESIFLRCKFGRCDRRASTQKDWATNKPPVVVDYTFADFRKVMRDCRDAGIDKAEMCLVGFQPGGHDGSFPDLFPADARFGGEAGMREAIAYGKSLGYRMAIHLNQHDLYSDAPRWCAADAAKGPDGHLRRYKLEPGGMIYFSCYETICNRYFDKDLLDMKALGLDGLVHGDVLSARLPERCHDPRHPNSAEGGRAWQRRIARKARAAFGGYSSESGCDHFAAELDNVLYQSPYPGWDAPKTSLVDGTLPLWSIVYNGIILSNPFYGTIDAGISHVTGGTSEALGRNASVYGFLETAERTFLTLVEYGGRPMYYYCDYRQHIPAIARVYRAWRSLRHLQLEFIREHVRLAPQVFAMRYENGEEVVVNYSDTPFAWRGRDVPSLGFEVYGK